MLRVFLALVLAFAVLAPPRLHAMASHTHAIATSHHHDCPGHDDDGTAQRRHAICMAACACLPASMLLPVADYTYISGEKLTLPVEAAPPSLTPETPLRPPKAHR